MGRCGRLHLESQHEGARGWNIASLTTAWSYTPSSRPPQMAMRSLLKQAPENVLSIFWTEMTNSLGREEYKFEVFPFNLITLTKDISFSALSHG